MAITISALKTDVSEEVGGASGTYFDSRFLRAVNSTIRHLNDKCFREITEIDGDDTTIDEDQDYYSVFLAGCLYYISIGGSYSKKGDNSRLADYLREVAIAQKRSIDESAPDVLGPESCWGATG